MKKKIVILLFTVMLFAFVGGVCTFAAVGDVIGHTTYTDIRAYINHYGIQSYNVNGYTVVIAEELPRFGFHVIWNPEDRSLKITRNTEMNTMGWGVPPQLTSPHLWGTPAYDILETDIKTYINDVEVTSYNINGKTAINIASLAVFGGVTYDQTYRVIKLWITDGLEMLETEEKFSPLPKYTLFNSYGNTVSVYEYEIADYAKDGWYQTFEEAIKAKQKADDEKYAQKSKAVLNKFFIGQDVVDYNLFFTRFGTIRNINSNNGKILVYWYYAEDEYGYEITGFWDGAPAALHTEQWVFASELSPIY